jgi:hypothetical protein
MRFHTFFKLLQYDEHMSWVTRIPGTLRITLAGVSLGIFLFVIYHYAKHGRELMDFTNKGAILAAKIPPIDVSAPERVETATFALG